MQTNSKHSPNESFKLLAICFCALLFTTLTIQSQVKTTWKRSLDLENEKVQNSSRLTQSLNLMNNQTIMLLRSTSTRGIGWGNRWNLKRIQSGLPLRKNANRTTLTASKTINTMI